MRTVKRTRRDCFVEGNAASRTRTLRVERPRAPSRPGGEKVTATKLTKLGHLDKKP